MRRSKRIDGSILLGLALFLAVSPSSAGSVIADDPDPYGLASVIDEGPDPIAEATVATEGPDPISRVTVINDNPDPFSTGVRIGAAVTCRAGIGADGPGVIDDPDPFGPRPGLPPSASIDDGPDPMRALSELVSVVWCTTELLTSVSDAELIGCFDDGPWSLPLLMEITP